MPDILPMPDGAGRLTAWNFARTQRELLLLVQCSLDLGVKPLNIHAELYPRIRYTVPAPASPEQVNAVLDSLFTNDVQRAKRLLIEIFLPVA